MSGPDLDSIDVRAVASRVIAGTRQVVGPLTLISNGDRTIAVKGAEIVRPQLIGELGVSSPIDSLPDS